MKDCLNNYGKSIGYINQKSLQVSTLSSSDLLTNWDYTTQQVNDLAEKIDKIEHGSIPQNSPNTFAIKKDNPVGKISADGYMQI